MSQAKRPYCNTTTSNNNNTNNNSGVPRLVMKKAKSQQQQPKHNHFEEDMMIDEDPKATDIGGGSIGCSGNPTGVAANLSRKIATLPQPPPKKKFVIKLNKVYPLKLWSLRNCGYKLAFDVPSSLNVCA
ncbi:hypothetical protein GIB67_002690 [Kingdonia uniflora]|uniref:Uncharacterized protein n=1 Tax=Kingdonia uniflora TaxID=39325 RepID=A0A7J7LJJ0_9MAGN|nr:hypothetical protein GIB67_002690 [Kingdonia uniflora]